MTPDPRTLIHPPMPTGTIHDLHTPEALTTWLAALDTSDDLADLYGPDADALNEAATTALDDLDTLIHAARRILTTHHDNDEPNVRAARCHTCGYVTTNPTTIDLWEGYGDHDGATDACQNGHTAWTLPNGETHLVGPADWTPALPDPWRIVPADPNDHTYLHRPRRTHPRTGTPYVHAGPADPNDEASTPQP